MAEFCLKCYNELNNTSYTEHDVVLSKELDLCEGCGRWKRTIVTFRLNLWRRLWFPWM